MKRALFHSLFSALTLIAVAVGPFSTPGMAMESKKGGKDVLDMDPHVAYMRKALNEHEFYPSHFSLAPKEEAVKIFDIHEHTQQRIQALHESHLKSQSFKPIPLTQATSTYSSWWNMLPSMPSLPSLWSKTPPVPETCDPSPLTVSSFYVIPSQTSTSDPILTQSSSTPILQPSSPTNVSIIENYSRRSSETDPIELGLSLMGGGGRGYMEALWLKRLMDEAKAPIWRIFPCIAGVSVGAILGLGVANPNIQVSELESFFTTDFEQVFPTDNYWNLPVKIWDSVSSILYPQYEAGPLETLLHQRNGELTMDGLLTDVVATAINTKTNELHTFSRDNNGKLPLWEVQRASSAAPTKFKAYEIDGIPYIDGGLGENNPVLRLLMRMRQLSEQRNQPFSLDNVTVLSLGTGDMPVDSIPNNAGLSSAGRIINACMDVQSNAADMTARSLVTNYKFINPKLSKVIPLDILDVETRDLLRTAAESKYEEIENFAQLDVVQRQLERAQY